MCDNIGKLCCIIQGADHIGNFYCSEQPAIAADYFRVPVVWIDPMNDDINPGKFTFQPAVLGAVGFNERSECLRVSCREIPQ